MGNKKKSKKYWNNFTNLEAELLTFIKEHGNAGVMPTHDELKKAGRSDLSRAIHECHEDKRDRLS